MKVWPKFNKDNPCSACGHFDWTCRYGDTHFVCMRIKSQFPNRDGGWLHPLEKSFSKPAPKQPRPLQTTTIDQSYQAISKFKSCGEDFAKSLGVSLEALQALGCCWSDYYQAYVFPMRDGENKIIGYRLRNMAGKKWAIMGSQQGIFIPQIEKQKVCLICEGPTDTAAALTLGFFAIGRPSCNGGTDQIKVALKYLGIFRVVIVSDNDQPKQVGNRKNARPGFEGAVKLKSELGLPSVLWLPPSPIKDIREFLNKGGTKELVESQIKQSIWTK